MSDVLSALPHVSGHDFSWLAQFFSLLVLPFAHEDLAVIVGAYVVVNDIMPVGLVALCIYTGMVASDVALYGIGASARCVPWLRRLAIDDRVRTLPPCSSAISLGSWRSAAWCLAWCSSPSLPAVGHACRSSASSRRVLSFPHFICRSSSVLRSSSATRSTVAPVGGRGHSSLA